MKILIVEDEPSLRETMTTALKKDGYVIETASNFNEARSKIGVYDYDCILLDIMLPDGSGLELLKELKTIKKSDSVIIISAKDSIDDKVTGLELGADDYLAKPFHLAELNARIKSVVRRKLNNGELAIEAGNVKIFPDKKRVIINGEAIVLSKKEYDILYYFINRRDYLITKESLAEGVWGDYIDQCDNYDFIYAQLKNLRKKLDEANADVEIKTIYGFGYKFVVK
ncbi:MAG: response regulator transcription factor [Bacteroidales bacterium]|nr:response regulator transcription factor [Bacteroidales bacterium]